VLDLNISSHGSPESLLTAVAYPVPLPRRVARGRDRDRLWLALFRESSEQTGETAEKAWLEAAATHYYRTSGSVSLALRQAFEALNQQALAYNQRTGAHVSWAAVAFILRVDQVYLGLSGNLHVLLLGGETVQDLYDSALVGRGLGLGRSLSMRFYHWPAQPGQMCLVCRELPASLNALLLQGRNRIRMEDLSTSGCLESSGPMWYLVQALPGNGRIEMVSSPSSAQQGSLAGRSTSERGERSVTEADRVPGAVQSGTAGVKPTPASQVKASRGGVRFLGGALKSRPGQFQGVTVESRSPNAGGHDESFASAAGQARPRSRAPSGIEKALRRTLVAFWQGAEALQTRLRAWVGRFLPRLLPSDAPTVHLSPGFLIFTAIAIPLAVVAVALAVYLYQGRMEQHRLYLQQAGQVVAQAMAQDDAALKRVNLEAALTWLDKAEEYGQSDDSRAMRSQIYQALDEMDGIKRLVFQALLPTPLDPAVNITRIVASQGDDLYLLDGNQGRVLRLVATRGGYVQDAQFICQPGPVGSLIISPLVDLLALPITNLHNAQVMAIDGTGNLVYCGFKGSEPILDSVALQPPDQGWMQVAGMTIRQGNLLVLDPGQNGLFEYQGNQWDFIGAPRSIFGVQVISLADVVDLAAYQEDVFILHQDGHVTRCTGSNCMEPFPYRLTQGGQVQEVERLNAGFTQWVLTTPPDPAIYSLDATNNAVYYLSLMLSLQQQYRASLVEGERLPNSPATAFTITPGRNLVLAFGNRLYAAPLP